MSNALRTGAAILCLVSLYGAEAQAQRIGGGAGVEAEPKAPEAPDVKKRVESLEREVARLRAKVARLEAQQKWPPSARPVPTRPTEDPTPAEDPTPVEEPTPPLPPVTRSKRVRKLTPLSHLRIAIEVPGDDRAAAIRCGRLRAGWEVVNRVLGAACVDRLDPHQRVAARRAAAESFLGERALPLRSGLWSYRARAELSATRTAVLTAVQLKQRLGKLRFVLVGRGLRGPREARRAALLAAAKLLREHGLTQGDRDPDAALVCALRGKIALRGGVLRCVGVTGRVFDRRTGAVIARVHLPPQRTVLKGDPEDAVKRYGRVVGRELARNMAQCLLASVVPPCSD